MKKKKMATKATSNQVVEQTPSRIKEKEEELQSTMLQKRLILIKRRQLKSLKAIEEIFRKMKNVGIKKSIRR